MSSTDGQWEYETLRPPRGATKKEAIDPKAQLNELGSDGWEFVSTVEYVGGGTKYLVFKRPADTDSDETTDSDKTPDSDGDEGGKAVEAADGDADVETEDGTATDERTAADDGTNAGTDSGEDDG